MVLVLYKSYLSVWYKIKESVYNVKCLCETHFYYTGKLFFSILCPLFLFWIAVGGYGQRQKGQPCWGTLPGPEHLLSCKEHAHTPTYRGLQGCQEWPWGQNNQFTELPFLLYYCINMKLLSFCSNVLMTCWIASLFLCLLCSTSFNIKITKYFKTKILCSASVILWFCNLSNFLLMLV